MAYLASTPHDRGLRGAFKAFPAHFRPILESAEAVLAAPAGLSRGDREAVGAFVSAQNQCHYCHRIHYHVARELGATDELLEAADTGKLPAQAKPRERAMLQFALELTHQPAASSQVAMDRLTAATSLADADVLVLLGVIAHFNYINRVVLALGFDQSEERAQRSGRFLAQNGYLANLQELQR